MCVWKKSNSSKRPFEFCGCAPPTAGEDGELPSAVAALLRPAAVATYQASLSAAFTAAAEGRRLAKDKCSKGLDDAWVRLQLYARGGELLEVSWHRV
jgi:hypothetical protein